MNHKELDSWKVSIQLVESVYRLTAELPKDERFGLKSQMRRSAISIPSNIAEGCARNSDAQLLQFINIAIGSLAELETELIILQRVMGIKCDDIMMQLVRVRRLILGTRNYLIKKTKRKLS